MNERRLRLWALAVTALAAAGCGATPSFQEARERKVNTPNESADATAADGGADAGQGDAGADSGTDSADGKNGDGASGIEGDLPGDDEAAVADKLRRLPKFGLLVNDLECGLCHVSVQGDVVSSRRVPPLWASSNAFVQGRWLAAEAFDAATPQCAEAGCLGSAVTVTATGGIHPNYSGPELPRDVTSDGKPDFPTIDFARMPTLMRGSVKTQGAFAVSVDKIYTGNLVLVGTKDQPIVVKDDILVTGDLVIRGWYTGVGTIYVQGNIYVPSDLRAVRSAFPFPDDEAKALALATAQMQEQSTDALGLATARSIFIADLEKQQTSDAGNETLTVYNHPATPVNRRAEALGTLDVYKWFPGGKAGFDALYANAVGCLTQAATQIGSFNLVEAFLYAHDTVAGISRRASYSIRGGVIADYFHIVSGASRCDATPSTVHGKPGNRSYIEYDWRLKTGMLRVLEHVGENFPEQ